MIGPRPVASFIVWTDGSGTTGGPAGIAYVGIGDDGIFEASIPVQNATNQQAEILAAAFALHALPAGSVVTVVSDSEYVVKGWSDPDRLPLWRTNGWKKKSGGDVANPRHWQRLVEAADRHREVSFEWIRGHDGNDQNERADALAKEARQTAAAEYREVA